MHPGLGRLPEFDDRSRAFAAPPAGPIRALQSAYWPCPEVLDQGTEGACVGYSLTHHLLADPIDLPMKYEQRMARRIYRRAKRVDQWPGEDYAGTSILAGCKILKRHGVVAGYRWAFGLADVVQVVAYDGPVVLGINWYESMYEPTGGRVEPEGRVAGGHAILCNGVDVDRETVTLHNSWGSGWGDRGEANLSWVHLDRLLREQGEAVRLVRP
jgi:hypothetical protein